MATLCPPASLSSVKIQTFRTEPQVDVWVQLITNVVILWPHGQRWLTSCVFINGWIPVWLAYGAARAVFVVQVLKEASASLVGKVLVGFMVLLVPVLSVFICQKCPAHSQKKTCVTLTETRKNMHWLEFFIIQFNKLVHIRTRYLICVPGTYRNWVVLWNDLLPYTYRVYTRKIHTWHACNGLGTVPTRFILGKYTLCFFF